MRIGIIGAGKVGASLGLYLSSSMATIVGVYDTNQEIANQVATSLQTKHYDELESLVSASDVLFMTVTDGAISSVWEQIATFNLAEKIICHCSGALSSEVFVGIEEKGACGYSVHPAMIVSNHEAVAALAKSAFTIEGTPRRLHEVKEIFTQMGNRVCEIAVSDKVRYHAAAVIISNFSVALAKISIDMLASCGFTEEEQKIFLPLMQTSVTDIAENGIIAALAGPIERADTGTIEKHLAELVGDEKEIYRLLANQNLAIARRKNPQRNYDDLAVVLSKK